MPAVLDVAQNHVLRTVRRYGVDVDVRRRPLLLLGAAMLLAAGIAGAALGVLLGTTLDARAAMSPAEVVVWSVPVGVVLLVVVSSPARTLHGALDSPRSWSLLAQAGVSPAAFVDGRYVVVEAGKSAVVLLAYASFVICFLAGSGASGDVAVVSVVALLALTAACLARFVVVLRRAVRRVHRRRRGPVLRRLLVGVLLAAPAGWLLVTVAGDVAAEVEAGATDRLASAIASAGPVLPAVAVVAVGLLAAAVVRAHAALGRASWADVFEATAEERAVRIAAPALPATPLWAVTAVDLRRLFRSAALRLRPLVNVTAAAALLVGAAAAWSATGGEIGIPADAPRSQLAAGAAALIVYGAVVASAGLLALDADRHALTLWQLVPGALRRVAAARAAQGAVIALAVAVIAVPALGWLLGLTAGDLTLCVVAAATMATFGPVLDLLGSLRWPQVDWVEAGEIGTSHPGRYAVGFLVGIPVVGAMALLQGPAAAAGPVHLAVLAVLLLVVVPVLAASVMRVALFAFGRSLHA